jgi:hypothetical protein
MSFSGMFLGASLAGWRIEILATDISAEVLEKAKSGVYSQFEVQRGLPIQLLIKYFTQVGDCWQLSPEIKAMVQFRPFNLLNDFAPLGVFDLLFCRNVLIYFDQESKVAVLDRLARQIDPDGYLVLGAAETVVGLTERFRPHPDRRGLYAKRQAGERRHAAARRGRPALARVSRLYWAGWRWSPMSASLQLRHESGHAGGPGRAQHGLLSLRLAQSDTDGSNSVQAATLSRAFTSRSASERCWSAKRERESNRKRSGVST